MPSPLPDVMCSFFQLWDDSHSVVILLCFIHGCICGRIYRPKGWRKKNETQTTYGVIFSFLICLQWTFRLIPYLAVVSNISVNIQNCDYIDCDYITKGESLKSLFLNFRKFHIVFYNHCIYLHSCQWCRSILFWICHILSFCKYLSRQLWDFFGT